MFTLTKLLTFLFLIIIVIIYANIQLLTFVRNPNTLLSVVASLLTEMNLKDKFFLFFFPVLD